MAIYKPTFWITNICPRNVSLADLNLTVKAYSSINLLDKNHYSYTLDQIQKSIASGSIFNKRNKIVVRNVPPLTLKDGIPINKDSIIPSRERSVLSIKNENYDELKITDDEYAEENAELADLDTQKININKV